MKITQNNRTIFMTKNSVIIPRTMFSVQEQSLFYDNSVIVMITVFSRKNHVIVPRTKFFQENDIFHNEHDLFMMNNVIEKNKIKKVEEEKMRRSLLEDS